MYLNRTKPLLEYFRLIKLKHILDAMFIKLNNLLSTSEHKKKFRKGRYPN